MADLPLNTVGDCEGPWVDPEIYSSLIERCKRGWNTPINELTNELLATYLRQKIALQLVVPEARKRLREGYIDDTELDEEELANALRSATGEA